MKTYRPKKLVDGALIGTPFVNLKLVALADKKFKGTDEIQVIFKDEVMFIYKDTKPLVISDEPFEDKFGGDSYYLYYYLWKPNVQTLF